jgi:uncharacterized protein (DUF305 family)
MSFHSSPNYPSGQHLGRRIRVMPSMSRQPVASVLILICVLAGFAAASPAAAGEPVAGFPAGQPRDSVNQADVAFVSGMIAHHAQAVLMAGWAPANGAGPSVRILCERIVVSQRDEIALMQQWLRDHGQPVPAGDAAHDMMPGMDHSMLMPGMLTAEQLTELHAATGPEFDRLFLTNMIRHHEGAVTMVQQLISTPGAARDNFIFKLAADINADQTTEIDRMKRMLAQQLLGAPGP